MGVEIPVFDRFTGNSVDYIACYENSYCDTYDEDLGVYLLLANAIGIFQQWQIFKYPSSDLRLFRRSRMSAVFRLRAGCPH